MTDLAYWQNMARYRNDPNYPFWQMLKEGYDQFEITKTPPKVDVCESRRAAARWKSQWLGDRRCRRLSRNGGGHGSQQQVRAPIGHAIDNRLGFATGRHQAGLPEFRQLLR